MIMMYHGTCVDGWAETQQQGFLLHRRFIDDKEISPCTYLATDLEEARCYGEYVLEVQFDPVVDVPNNYHPDAWQCRCYATIPIDRITLIEQPHEV